MMAQKTVLITGCSEGGIGFTLAQEFQKRGLHVFATARSIGKMNNLEKLPNVTLLALDVTSEASIVAAVTAVHSARGGKLDYLINNAGSIYCMPILDVDIQKSKELFEVNFWGVMAVTKAFSPLVISARGCIINISSIAGLLYPPFLSVYAASKSAINTVSEILRLELKPFGVKVVTVVTGSIESNIFDNAPEYHLPSDSRYHEVEKAIAARAAGTDWASKSTREGFARSLVSDVLNGAKGKVYRGSMSTIVRLVSSFMPTTVVDYMSTWGTGLDHISSKAKDV